MHPILRNILAVIAGIIVGGVINMGIITISGDVIAYPEGLDLTNPESLKANIHLFQLFHLIIIY